MLFLQNNPCGPEALTSALGGARVLWGFPAMRAGGRNLTQYNERDCLKQWSRTMSLMSFEFSGTIWYWKGPAPWYFVTVPSEQSHDLKAIAGFVTYGWGVIPVRVQIGGTVWLTSLFPRDALYLVPIKASVREAENLEEGDTVTVRLGVG